MKKLLISLLGLALGLASLQAGATYILRAPSQGLQPTPAATSASAPSDPDWPSVAALLHMDGTNGSTSFSDQKGGSWSPSGSVTVSTGNSEFGGASSFFPSSGMNALAGPVINLTGDFTIEFWANPTNTSASFIPMLTQWEQVTGQGGFTFGLASGALDYYFGPYSEASPLLSGGTVPANTWSHLAVTRQGSTFREFINGSQVATATFATAGKTLSIPLALGNYYNGSGALGAANATNFAGYVDDLRITNGVARYTANFAVPTQAFPNQ